MSLKIQIFIYFPLAYDGFIDKCNGKFFYLNKVSSHNISA